MQDFEDADKETLLLLIFLARGSFTNKMVVSNILI